MLDFSNTQIAFAYKRDSDLRLAQILFSAINSKVLVRVLKGATDVAMYVRMPVGWAVKPTLYRQFVGGETLEESSKNIKSLYESHITSVLDYSAEGGDSVADIENAFEETIRSIEFAAKHPKQISYTVFKPTAMTTDNILRKANFGKPLSSGEQIDYDAFLKRIDILCKTSFDLRVRILIDAEDYCYQNEIDRVALEMMKKYNKQGTTVFNTLQMYRYDRMSYLETIYKQSVNENFYLGIKFVRGAYMEKERARAEEGGYPSPICSTKELTDINFDTALEFTVSHIDRIETFCGTHNEKSNLYLTSLLEKYGVAKNDARIFFAQLYGMSDNITYNLAYEGYNVSKYIPYAPVDKVLPYLIRRAEENTSMAGQTSRELYYINKEIERRRS